MTMRDTIPTVKRVQAEQLAADIAAHVSAGGVIDQIPNGVSAYNSTKDLDFRKRHKKEAREKGEKVRS